MFKVHVSNHGDSKYHAVAGNRQLVIDHDKKEAPGAIEAVLAALSACVAHYARDFFSNAEKVPGTLTVDSEANLTEDRVRFEDIRIAIGLDIPKLDAETERRLLKHIERCPIHGALRVGATIHVVVQYGA